VNSSDPILTLDQVTKNFGGLRVVEDLSFSVRRGSCTALIGPNGAGKTTVFNLITGVYPIDAGRILFDGVDISRVPSRRRIHCGVARNFQNIRLMPHLSTLENVLVGQHCQNSGWRGVLQPVSLIPGNRWREEARAALADAGLAHYERATVRSLPYGVQKRIELVRALMAKPRLLLLDEPAAGLNPAETDALRAHLAAICSERGISLLVVEHDMHFVGALCQEVVVLNFGRKIAEGSPADVREDLLVREAYLGIESEPAEPRQVGQSQVGQGQVGQGQVGQGQGAQQGEQLQDEQRHAS
jgi:branched-chain amino acid transport system ATP-binding protein